MREKVSAEDRVREIRRKTRKKYSSEEKVRMVLEGLRGEESIAALCRREGIPSNLDYRWSKGFLEAEKKRLAADTPALPTAPRGPQKIVAGRSDIRQTKRLQV